MTAEMQLRHYEMQKQQFMSLFQNWTTSFALWHEQFQSYPHKDQLQEYELQWKQWQEQMNATYVHLQERVVAFSAMVPFGAMMGQFGHYPGQEMHIPNPSIPPPTVAVGATAPGAVGTTATVVASSMAQSAAGALSLGQQPPPFMAHSESSDGPPMQGTLSAGAGDMPPGPLTTQSSSFNSVTSQRLVVSFVIPYVLLIFNVWWMFEKMQQKKGYLISFGLFEISISC